MRPNTTYLTPRTATLLRPTTRLGGNTEASVPASLPASCSPANASTPVPAPLWGVWGVWGVLLLSAVANRGLRARVRSVAVAEGLFGIRTPYLSSSSRRPAALRYIAANSSLDCFVDLNTRSTRLQMVLKCASFKLNISSYYPPVSSRDATAPFAELPSSSLKAKPQLASRGMDLLATSLSKRFAPLAAEA